MFGTRPEAIKLFPLLHILAADARFESRVCISAQHREMLDQVLDIADVAPEYDLDLMTPGQTLDELTARALVETGKVLDQEKPDWVVVQGDTTTVMAGALAAYRTTRCNPTVSGVRLYLKPDISPHRTDSHR